VTARNRPNCTAKLDEMIALVDALEGGSFKGGAASVNAYLHIMKVCVYVYIYMCVCVCVCVCVCACVFVCVNL
jgi:hypothetical protein